MISNMARAERRLDEHELIELVEQVANGDPHAFIPPGDTRRWGLALATDDVEVWVIAWPPGAGLAFHDHDGSTAAVCVLEGRLRERYLTPEGPAVRWLGGRTTVLPDDHVHEVINTDSIPAVSIHAYSPPVGEMAFRADPAFDVAAGD